MEAGKEIEDEDLEGAEEVLKANGVSGRIVAKMLKGLKQKGERADEGVKAVVIMSEAVKQSQLAEKAYWDYKHDKVRSDADFSRAEELVMRGVRNLDRAMLWFPTTTSSLEPVKKKLMIQYIDIQHQRKGEILSVEQLEKEYEEWVKSAVGKAVEVEE